MSPAAPQGDDVDAVVIGAGIAGAAAAAALVAHGAASGAPPRVVLLERESQPAHHASGRSAAVLSETSGHPLVCGLARLSRPWFEETDEHQGSLLSPRGLVWVGRSGDAPLLDDLARQGRAVRDTVRRIDAADVEALLPGFRGDACAAGGVYEPDAMAIDAAAAISRLLRSLRAHGGTIALADEALELRRGADEWVVRTAGRQWRTSTVVNAAGAWVDEVATRAGLAPLGMVALRRTAAVVRAPDVVRSWPLVMDVAGRYYFEPEPGGLLVSPADETPVAPCDARPDELDVAEAIERVAEATGLDLRSVRAAWAGLRTFAPDRAPVLGEDPRAAGFWWCAGQGGAGIKTAPAMGEALALLHAGDELPADWAPLGISRAALSPARFR